MARPKTTNFGPNHASSAGQQSSIRRHELEKATANGFLRSQLEVQDPWGDLGNCGGRATLTLSRVVSAHHELRTKEDSNLHQDTDICLRSRIATPYPVGDRSFTLGKKIKFKGEETRTVARLARPNGESVEDVYMPTLTPGTTPIDRQSYGTFMGRVWDRLSPPEQLGVDGHGDRLAAAARQDHVDAQSLAASVGRPHPLHRQSARAPAALGAPPGGAIGAGSGGRHGGMGDQNGSRRRSLGEGRTT